MAQKIRIGCVSYLNSKVLIHGIEPEGDDHVLTLVEPSKLADQLEAREIDVGLIPAVEYFRIPDLCIVPNVSISARGPVDSVKLFAKKPLAELGKVALDTSSRSSAALLKIILQERHRIAPEYKELNRSSPGADVDAYLMIGDPCLKHEPGANIQSYDLAELWWELVRAPFVFAVWACHQDTDLRGIDRMLRDAKVQGLKSVESIAETAAEALKFETGRVLEYITKRIGYDLSPKEMSGLQTFYRYLVKNGLEQEGKRIDFYNR